MSRERACIANSSSSPEKSCVSELLLLSTLEFFSKSSLFMSNPNPFLSVIISFYFLVLLYVPHLFFSIAFSPVLISTATLLAALLRLGAVQKHRNQIFRPQIDDFDLARDKQECSEQKDPIFPAQIHDEKCSLEADVARLGLVQKDKGEFFVGGEGVRESQLNHLVSCRCGDVADDQSDTGKTVTCLCVDKQDKDSIFAAADLEALAPEVNADSLCQSVTEKGTAFRPELGGADTEEEADIFERLEKCFFGSVANKIFEQNIGENDTKLQDFGRKPDFSDAFLEWNRNGPLQVIYEDYEGEQEEKEGNSPENLQRQVYGSDSESLEGESPAMWELPENLCFMWEEREGLIEIPLESKSTVGFDLDEENLIEINLAAAVVG